MDDPKQCTACRNKNRGDTRNFVVLWTGLKVLKHDGSQHHLVGIQPTVPVQRTIAAIRAGIDEDIETALDLILED